jgi:dinuclear metal center YbgI/SA1388 family protein
MTLSIQQLDTFLRELLQPSAFKDYCPNGLQVMGQRPIRHLVTGVTASQRLIDAAIAAQADAVLVHHGYFWRGEDATLTGMKYQRVKTLMDAGLSLWAYHLPLDAHPTLGNNVQLAALMDWQITGPLRDETHPIGLCGRLAQPQSVSGLLADIESRLGWAPTHVAGGPEQVQTLAWCTGAAQGMIEDAVRAGVDVYLSGEISEPTAHVAQEMGIHYIAAGHHATERYGVQALGQHIADTFGCTHTFIDCPIPV